MANPVLGADRHKYELVPDWAKVPDSIKLGFTHGVCVNAQNRVYIFNQSDHAMCVFDEDGTFVKSWNNGYDKGAHGLTLVTENGQEFLWLCDYSTQRVVKTTLDGKEVLKLPIPPRKEIYPEDKNYIPTNVAPIPDGDIYVADGYGRSWIHQFSNRGQYIRSFGGKGSEPGQFDCPHGIVIDTRSSKPSRARRRPRQRAATGARPSTAIRSPATARKTCAIHVISTSPPTAICSSRTCMAG